jgi:hypothetical protein
MVIIQPATLHTILLIQTKSDTLNGGHYLDHQNLRNFRKFRSAHSHQSTHWPTCLTLKCATDCDRILPHDFRNNDCIMHFSNYSLLSIYSVHTTPMGLAYWYETVINLRKQKHLALSPILRSQMIRCFKKLEIQCPWSFKRTFGLTHCPIPKLFAHTEHLKLNPRLWSIHIALSALKPFRDTINPSLWLPSHPQYPLLTQKAY